LQIDSCGLDGWENDRVADCTSCGLYELRFQIWLQLHI
jgi:hypothetical protein